MATKETPDLPMAPMVALFVLLVVFMIQFYAASGATLNLSADTVLPESTAADPIEQAVQVEVSRDYIVLEGVRIASIDELGGTDLNIEALESGLERMKERTQRLARGNPDVNFDGRLILMADKRVKYDIITRIMYTSGRVGYNQINMAVLQAGG